jgi:hypothetical protein
MREFRTDEECAHDRVHRSSREIERDERTKLPKGHGTHAWSSTQAFTVTEELRQAKLKRLRGDMDAVSVGLDTPRWRGTRMTVEMPSLDGRGVRSCSRKLAAAEFYGPRWHRRNGGGSKRSEANEEELARVLAELGAT